MDLMTIDETADALRVSRWTVQRLIDAQKLAAVLVGAGARKRQQRIRRADLERFVSERLTIQAGRERGKRGRQC